MPRRAIAENFAENFAQGAFGPRGPKLARGEKIESCLAKFLCYRVSVALKNLNAKR
jgi:hypothetical protein